MATFVSKNLELIPADQIENALKTLKLKVYGIATDSHVVTSPRKAKSLPETPTVPVYGCELKGCYQESPFESQGLITYTKLVVGDVVRATSGEYLKVIAEHNKMVSYVPMSERLNARRFAIMEAKLGLEEKQIQHSMSTLQAEIDAM